MMPAFQHSRSTQQLHNCNSQGLNKALWRSFPPAGKATMEDGTEGSTSRTPPALSSAATRSFTRSHSLVVASVGPARKLPSPSYLHHGFRFSAF